MRGQIKACTTWLLILIVVVVTLSVLICRSVRSETAAQVISSVRQRSVLIDATRFPDSTILNFANTELLRITVKGQTLQRETTYVVSLTARSYRLPTNTYLPVTVILNADPTADAGKSFPVRLQYVPYAQTGAVFAVKSTGRPTQFSTWGDSLYLDVTSKNEDLDSVRFAYFALPTKLTTTSDTVGIPDAYLPLLKDRILLACYAKIVTAPPNQAQIEKDADDLETKLLGRPADAH